MRSYILINDTYKLCQDLIEMQKHGNICFPRGDEELFFNQRGVDYHVEKIEVLDDDDANFLSSYSSKSHGPRERGSSFIYWCEVTETNPCLPPIPPVSVEPG